MSRKLIHSFCVFLVLLCSVECLALDEARLVVQESGYHVYYDSIP